MKLREQYSSGYSVIQLMIGLAISAFIIAAAMYMFISGGKSRQLDHAKTIMLTNERQILQKIKMDLDRAIKVTGASSIQDRPGISGRVTARPAGELIDPLNLYVEEFGQFSWSDMTTPTKGALNSYGEFQVNGVSASASEVNEAGFIYKVLTSNDYFFISNIQKSNVLKKSPLTPAPGGSDPVLIYFDPTNFNSSDFAGSQNNLRAVSEIQYVVNSKQQLVRKQRMKSTGLWNESILAEGVKKFLVDYIFNSKNYQNINFQPAPPGREAPVSSVSELVGTINPAPTWTDIHSVRISLEFTSKGPAGIQIASIDDTGFSLQNEELTRKASLWFSPLKFSLKPFDEGMQGEEVCRPADVTTHCNSEFSGCFTSENRSDPRWKGYADVDGPYCQCLGGTTSMPTNLSWENSTDRARLNQCVAAFDGCGNGTLQGMHPGMQMACGCLQGRETYYDASPTMDSTLGYQTYHFRENLMPKSVSALDLPGGSSNDISCRVYQNVVPNNLGGWTCDASAQRYFTGFGSSSTVNTWSSTCGCRATDFDSAGNDTGTLISGWSKNFIKLCGTDSNQSSGNPDVACGNTVVVNSSNPMNNEYRLRNSSNPQGLTPEEAALCGCINRSNQEQSIPGNQYPAIPLPPGNGGATTEWDLRELRWDGLTPATSPADPTPYVEPPWSTFGSHLPRSITVNIQGGGSVTNTCDVAFCQDGRWGKNCATLPADPLVLPPGWPNPGVTAPNPAWLTTHASYCGPLVSMWNYEIRIIREKLTGTAPGGTLPPNCGGPTSGGSL